MTRAILLAVLSLGTRAAEAQWSVVVLHPPGAAESDCYAVTPTTQGGYARFPQPNFDVPPVLWSGSAASWVSLAPSFGEYGEVRAIHGSQQAGQLNLRAALWSGTASSAVDLNPSWAGTSIAFATNGVQQVGRSTLLANGDPHATLWSGTGASAIDLHPAGAQHRYSLAAAIDGDTQGGYVQFADPNIFQHAAVWRGNAASWIDLNPGTGYTSRINGMANGVQVGATKQPGDSDHAAIWRGSVASWIDLGSGELRATTGTIHVGTHPGTGLARAGIWFGDTSAGFIDLHPLLPPGFSTFSTATSVYEDNGRVWVGGIASRNGVHEAVMWVFVPAPGVLAALVAAAGLAPRRRRRVAMLRP